MSGETIYNPEWVAKGNRARQLQEDSIRRLSENTRIAYENMKEATKRQSGTSGTNPYS